MQTLLILYVVNFKMEESLIWMKKPLNSWRSKNFKWGDSSNIFILSPCTATYPTK